MSTHQMMPPVVQGGKTVTTTIFGRVYSAAPGAVVMAASATDADVLDANGWVRCCRNATGTTTQRPVPGFKGYEYLDTTLGYVIVWDGATFRNPATGASV
jgi:hypothetical protein